MAKMVIIGDVLVITSTAKFEYLKMLEKYKPKALELSETNENGKQEVTFKIGTTRNGGKGALNRMGVSFDCATYDDEKLAFVRFDIPEGTVDAREWAAEFVGTAIHKLEIIEEQIPFAVAEILADKAAVLAKITVA